MHCPFLIIFRAWVLLIAILFSHSMLLLQCTMGFLALIHHQMSFSWIDTTRMSFIWIDSTKCHSFGLTASTVSHFDWQHELSFIWIGSIELHRWRKQEKFVMIYNGSFLGNRQGKEVFLFQIKLEGAWIYQLQGACPCTFTPLLRKPGPNKFPPPPHPTPLFSRMFCLVPK